MDLHRCPICGSEYGFREAAEHCCDGLDNGQRRRVTRMRARIAKLEAALRELADASEAFDNDDCVKTALAYDDAQRKARALLEDDAQEAQDE